jgi:uncharacterized damage-inducible protein DinB
MMDRDLLKTQLEYSFRASEQVLASLEQAPDSDLRRNLGSSHGGLLDTLVHIYGADRVWLSRLVGRPRLRMFDPGESWTLESLREDWRELRRGWLEWADSVKDARANLAYRNLSGEPFEVELWQVVFHVVNHATYHRGQITTMLRQLGYKPVPTDLHTFYLNAAKQHQQEASGPHQDRR